MLITIDWEGQVAEAWGKRWNDRHFVSKLTDADAEQRETQHGIETGQDCGYLTVYQVTCFSLDLEEIGRMLNSLIRKAASFRSSIDDVVLEPPDRPWGCGY